MTALRRSAWLVALALSLICAGSANGAVTGLASTPAGDGYWLVSADGAVVARGAAGWHSDARGLLLSKPVSAILSSQDGRGYRLIARDGGVFNYGSAQSLAGGSLAGYPLNGEIVGAISSPSGHGYRMAGTDGGVFNFGDLQALSPGGLANAPPPPSGAIVAIAGTPTGRGYWLAGRDGHVYAFGDAPVLPDAGGVALAKPIVGIAAHGAAGYWLLAADGGVFAFGSAPFLGSLAGRPLTADGVAISSTPGPAGGFRIALADGTVHAFESPGRPTVESGATESSAAPGRPVAAPSPPAGLRRLARRPKAHLGYSWVKRNGRKRLLGLDFVEVVNVVRGASVRLLCSSGRRPCPFQKRASRTAGSGGTVTFRARRALRAAVTVRVLVTQPGRIGSYTSWHLRRGQLLGTIARDKRSACVLHGSSRPISCR